jgi:hypothetical protein
MTSNGSGELIREWTTDDGWTLRAYREPDDYADTSWIGAYVDSPDTKPHDPIDILSGRYYKVAPVDTRSGPLFDSGQTYFRPQRGCEEHWRADEKRLRAYYAEEWSFGILTVVASREGIELGRSVLGGVESDAGEDQWRELANEQAGEALHEARAKLARLLATVATTNKSTEAVMEVAK